MSGSNAKGQLQEWFQREGLQAPTYAVKSSGPSNSPTFVCTVTVRLRSGEERSECVQIRGGKKKDAEHLAARKMIRNLQEGPGDSGRASSNLSRSVSSSRGRPDVSSSPSPPTLTPPTTGVSQVKILQERLQAEGSPLPQYTEVASRSPNMTFKVRCVLFNSRKQPVIETQGEGRSKQRAKENAALKMLTKLRVAPDPHGVGGKTTPDPPTVDHQDLDEDEKAANLSALSPQFHFWHSPGQTVCCVAWVVGVASCPLITGHGVGEVEAVAKREASRNLLSCIATLMA